LVAEEGFEPPTFGL